MKQRDLSELKLLAALASRKSLALQEVQELPLATAQNRKYQLSLICSRTGITVGTLHTLTVAGSVPLLGQWRDTQVLHPIFSLTPVALLQFARNTWLRFCALTPEETVDDKVVAKQEEQLRIAALAMLHNLTEVRQDIHWMPSFIDVVANWQGLMHICYWRAYLDSERFKFPTLRLSKLEKDIDLRSYLQICFQRKKDYESKVNEAIAAEKEKQQLRLAEMSLASIRDELAGKKPKSIKILWRWFEANMPTRYKKDLAGWMWELFSATEKTIFDFTMRDIALFEEIFLTEVPTGSSISHAFLEVLRGKHSLLSNHFEAYEILIPDSIAEEVASGAIDASGNEPQLADYPSRAKWFIARSKWRLAQPSARKHQGAAAQRQQQETVGASFHPKLMIGAAAEDLPEQEVEDEFEQIGINADMDQGERDE